MYIMCVYVCVCICVHMCVCMSMYMCGYAYVCMYIYIICIYVIMHMDISVYIYIPCLKQKLSHCFFDNKYINYLPIIIVFSLIKCTLLFILTTSPTNNIPYTLKFKMVFSEEDKHMKRRQFHSSAGDRMCKS